MGMAVSAGISVRDLCFGYGQGRILHNLNLEVAEGQLLALVGPNGAGKSTLLKVISGYLKPSQGQVLLGGTDVSALSDTERSRVVTYTGDEPDPAFDFTVEETVLMGRTAVLRRGLLQPGRQSSPQRGPFAEPDLARQAMQVTGVYSLKDRTITSLSSGERQRVYIARAIAQDPRVYLFDEPTAHLDMAFELEIMEVIKAMAQNAGKTVLVVLHDINLALRYASEVVFLKDGKLARKVSPAEVTPDIIRLVYGVKAELARHPILGYQMVIPVTPVQ